MYLLTPLQAEWLNDCNRRSTLLKFLTSNRRINDVVWSDFSKLFNFPRDWCADVYYYGWNHNEGTKQLYRLVSALVGDDLKTKTLEDYL